MGTPNSRRVDPFDAGRAPRLVDQATTEAEKLRKALEGKAEHFGALDESTRAQARQTAAELQKRLGFNDRRKLPISTLRGAHVDNREWLDDPAAPAIIVGTVDMIGSRLMFEGYGVSRKMRPYQAGLLSVDALIVLDEAHLIPPFAHLLRAIEHDGSFHPKDEADRALLPRFVFLPLSATQRGAQDVAGRASFRLREEDVRCDAIVRKRLSAKKRLWLHDVESRELEGALADEAWRLADEGRRPVRCVVYCNSRAVAENVKQAIDKKAARKKGDSLADAELFVGARRVHERDNAAEWLKGRGFIGEKGTLRKPAFLVATSAGEVGVDIDADHMVSDLVAWERMVQRLGRVNRRGEGDAEIKVLWSTPSVKDADAPTEAERLAWTAFASKAVIENLPQIDGAFDASPGALRQLAESARSDAALKAHIDAATTPEPLRPALNRALVDAWSMTSLETHTGRPDVAPWLRGWVEETPQTTIVWRTHLPVRIDDRGRTTIPGKKEIESFFEAAPPHESEGLETETYRVVDWLQKRAEAVKGKKAVVIDDEAETSESGALLEYIGSAEVADRGTIASSAPQSINAYDIVAMTLSRRGDFDKAYTLDELAEERDNNAKRTFEAALSGKTLIVNTRLGGLDEKGMLDPDEPLCKLAADADPWAWTESDAEHEPLVKFRIKEVSEIDDPNWKLRRSFITKPADDLNEAERLYIFKWRADAATEDDRSILPKVQSLANHSKQAKYFEEKIATALSLPARFVRMLCLAANLHDRGKARELWELSG